MTATATTSSSNHSTPVSATLDVDAKIIAEAVQRSYGACCANKKFFDDFYEVFVKASPKIGEKFAKTDFVKQKQLLRQSITYMIMFYSGSVMAKEVVNDLGKSHSKKRLDIAPELYSCWLESLMQTIKKYDKDFTPQLDRQWRIVLSKGVAHMKGMYLS